MAILSMTPAETAFLHWFASAQPGSYEYHRGHLAMLDLDKRPPVASLVLRLALREPAQVVIAQRRHGPDDYSYLAWRT